jgi:hypothetical protein
MKNLFKVHVKRAAREHPFSGPGGRRRDDEISFGNHVKRKGAAG